MIRNIKKSPIFGTAYGRGTSIFSIFSSAPHEKSWIKPWFLPRFSAYENSLLGVYSSCVTTFIFIGTVNSASTTFLTSTQAPTDPRTDNLQIEVGQSHLEMATLLSTRTDGYFLLIENTSLYKRFQDSLPLTC